MNVGKKCYGLLVVGFFVLLVGCTKTYTFENNSSLAVTVEPEYGDDFQIQPGAKKSFDSKHAKMSIMYRPSNYVDAQATKTNYYVFTDKVYISTQGNFIIVPPDSWEVIDYPESAFKVFIGKTDNNFAPNINFVEENINMTIQNYVSATATSLRQQGSEIISGSGFSTDEGVGGYKIETTTDNLVQYFYLFPINSVTKMVITCSASINSRIDYEEIFDNCAKTFELLQ
jgi:hypothetical protein